MRRSPSQLLENFLRHVLAVEASQGLQQQVYTAVLSRVVRDPENVITLVEKRWLINTKITTDAEPLLSCLRASGLPVNNIKTLKAKLRKIPEAEWDRLCVQTGQGSDTKLEVKGEVVCFSPRISEMLRSVRLTKFR